MPKSDQIKQGILDTNQSINELIELIKKSEELKDSPSLKKRLETKLNGIVKCNMEVGKKALTEIQKQESQLKKIDELTKANETLASENYLLQYKKKDLLVLANNLEDAYEEIAEKNRLITQKAQELSDANEAMRNQQEEIEEKTRELETQKESLEDQADYLYDANERITKMHQELQHQKDELVELNNEKNNLIGIVAHDLKSPLNQIEGLVSLIKLTATLDEESQKFVDTISISVQRLNTMISKILDTEAIESKKLNLNLEDVNLTKLVSDLVDSYKHTADEKNILLNNKLGSKPINVKVDASYTRQVFENLLSNAIKFSPSEKNIYINKSIKDGKAVIEIQDEGQGLSEDDMKKLFKKYQKLSARPTGNESSTGLGLSIVKKYVEKMKGDIWCESEQGKGASFFVSFATI